MLMDIVPRPVQDYILRVNITESGEALEENFKKADIFYVFNVSVRLL